MTKPESEIVARMDALWSAMQFCQGNPAATHVWNYLDSQMIDCYEAMMKYRPNGGYDPYRKRFYDDGE